MAHGFDRTDLLADNRDAYVAAARAPGRGFDLDVLVSGPRSALDIANALVEELRALGVRAEPSLSGDLGFLATALDSAQHLCLVVDDQREPLAGGRGRAVPAAHALGRRRPPAVPGPDQIGRSGAAARVPAQPSAPGARRRRAVTGRRETLHGRLSGNGTRPRPAQRLYADAAAALRRLQDSRLHYTRWYWVEQTVEAIAEALRTGDTDSLREATVDLELASRVPESAGAARERAEMPERLAPLISDMIGKLGRRAKI